MGEASVSTLYTSLTFAKLVHHSIPGSSIGALAQVSYHLEHLPGAVAIALKPQQNLVGATTAGDRMIRKWNCKLHGMQSRTQTYCGSTYHSSTYESESKKSTFPNRLGGNGVRISLAQSKSRNGYASICQAEAFGGRNKSCLSQ